MNMGKELSLYIHIPFCERKCLYCDFLSFNAEKELMGSYFKALSKEIQLSGKVYKDYIVRSVFFGGGTPSFPDHGKICNTLDQIKESFTMDDDCEISIEANPASAIYDKLQAYRNAGFNRLSIGAQSLNDEELKRLGRLHDSRQFFETYENARKAGFDNINIDVMSALPGQSFESYMDTVRKVIELRPEHISDYSLIIEEGTPFYDMDLELPDEEEDRLMYHETKKYLAQNGYHRYEISNYALGGQSDDTYECFHNKAYWIRSNYLGLGLGAASMIEDVRWSNIKDIKDYIAFMADDSSFDKIRENVENLSIEGRMEEFMFLGLRLVRGVDLNEFETLFKRTAEEVYAEVIYKYVEMGLLHRYVEKKSGHEYLCLTEKGLDVSNTVMADFLIE